MKLTPAVHETETIKQLVKGNLGVAYLPLFSVENELKAGVLLEIPTNARIAKISR